MDKYKLGDIVSDHLDLFMRGQKNGRHLAYGFGDSEPSDWLCLIDGGYATCLAILMKWNDPIKSM